MDKSPPSNLDEAFAVTPVDEATEPPKNKDDTKNAASVTVPISDEPLPQDPLNEKKRDNILRNSVPY